MLIVNNWYFRYGLSELAQRIFKYGAIPNNTLSADKELNSLIYWMSSCVITYTLLKVVRFLAHPVLCMSINCYLPAANKNSDIAIRFSVSRDLTLYQIWPKSNSPWLSYWSFSKFSHFFFNSSHVKIRRGVCEVSEWWFQAQRLAVTRHPRR